MPEPTRTRDTGRPQVPARATGPLNVRTATPRVEASTSSGRANLAERRNLATRQGLLRRITVEYDEMPGLCLSAAQAQRLLGNGAVLGREWRRAEALVITACGTHENSVPRKE